LAVTYAIVSDIHANLEALRVVLAEIDRLGVDDILCLGDLVGYNAEPDECIRVTLARAGLTVRGNHDRAVAGLMDLAWFNEAARQAALWTRTHCEKANLVDLQKLPRGPVSPGEGVLMCHGSPFDEDEYVLDPGSVGESYRCLDAKHPGIRFCLLGHTHLPMVMVRSKGRSKGTAARESEKVDISRGDVLLINPGSVGQPRDGNPMASFGILDTTRLVYRNLRVAYDVREAQRKMARAGLPAELAHRLAGGR
jgi:predicted phosphodiesterase